MPSGVAKENQRKDMIPPCRECVKRYPACHDHCTEPEYLEWKHLMELKRQDERARSMRSTLDMLPSEERYVIKR